MNTGAKKILLVNPHETAQDGFSNPPLGLLYLAGTLLQHGYEVRVVDGCLDGREGIFSALQAFGPDLVGITCLTPGRKKALEVARMVKDFNPGIKVVMGGAHPTIMYRQLLEHYPYIDIIVLGEGELTLLQIAQGKDPAHIDGIAYRHNGEIVTTPKRKYVKELDQLAFPAWHLIDFKRYEARGEGIVNGIDLAEETRVSVIFSRGCIGHCDFCSTWWIWRGWRRRSARNMVDELEWLNKRYSLKHFCFADDSMTVDRKATVELCDEITARGLNIAFHVTTRTDCVDDLVLYKLKQAGCYKIAFGIETGSPLLLKKMGKKNDIETSQRAIKLAKDAGIPVTALLIVGNMGETEETIGDTINFLRKTRPDEIGCVGGLWILPGTKLYRETKRNGFIDDSFWLTDEPYKVYTMEHSLAQLSHLQKKIYDYRSWSRKTADILKRMIR